MSNPWWLLPGDDCLNLPHVPLHVVYRGDNGTCWEFAVQSAPGAPRFRWHHQESRLIWPETQQIAETLRSPLALLCEMLGARIRSPDAGTVDRMILEAVAAAVAETDSVTGKRLRAAMPLVSGDQFSEAVRRLKPRFLWSNDYDTRDGLDVYQPTFNGLVDSNQAPLVDRIVQTTLELFHDKFRQDPDFSKFTLDEVFDRGGFTPKEKRFVYFVIGTARFGDGGGGSLSQGSPDASVYKWNTPSWIERLMKMSTTKEYLAHLRAGSKRLPSPTSPTILNLGERNLVERSIPRNPQVPHDLVQVPNSNREIMTRP